MDTKLFGKNLLLSRKDQELSQEQLANLTDVSRNYISMIERGEATNVSNEIVRKLAMGLQVPMEKLTGEPSDNFALTIPHSLREFGISRGLSYLVIDKLSQVPFRGKEPETPGEWETLYEAIKKFINPKD